MSSAQDSGNGSKRMVNRRSLSVSPTKSLIKKQVLRSGSISISPPTSTTKSVSPPDSPSKGNVPRYMWETANSTVNTVNKQVETAKEKPMHFTNSHSIKREDTNAIAGLLHQLAEKDRQLMEQAALLDSKDALIIQFTATCDRLKHDCEVLAERAFEWKNKYDQVVSKETIRKEDALRDVKTTVSVEAPDETTDSDGVSSSTCEANGEKPLTPKLTRSQRRRSSRKNRQQGTPSRRATLGGFTSDVNKTEWTVHDHAVKLNLETTVQGDECDSRHFMELIAQKDKTIQDYMQACTKYRVDCDTFCKKAMDWKKKHDDLAKQVMQLESDIFVLRGQRREMPTAAWGDETPVEPWVPSSDEVDNTEAYNAPRCAEVNEPLPGQIEDELAALKKIHEREVEALKLELARLQQSQRSQQLDVASFEALQAEYEQYKTTAEQQLEDMEGQLARFKNQLLVVNQDYSDQLREKTAYQVIQDCARVARDRIQQIQWNRDRNELVEAREKLAYLQQQVVNLSDMLNGQGDAGKISKSELETWQLRSQNEAARNKRLLRSYLKVRVNYARLRRRYANLSTVAANKPPAFDKDSVLVPELAAYKSRLNEISDKMVEEAKETSKLHFQLARKTEIILQLREKLQITRSQESISTEEALRRVAVLHSSIDRRRLREQAIQQNLQETSQELHRIEEEYAAFKESTSSALAMQENELMLYKAAIDVYCYATRV